MSANHVMLCSLLAGVLTLACAQQCSKLDGQCDGDTSLMLQTQAPAQAQAQLEHLQSSGDVDLGLEFREAEIA